MSTKLTTVHIRINDAATEQPTPVRLRITDAEGRYYPPLGRRAEFATDYGVDVGGNVRWGLKEYAFIDGTCEVPLPPGRLTVEVSKGPEYRPLRQEVTLAAGKLALRLRLERWINLRAEGWYSGDTWTQFITPHAALLEAAAEDVAVVNILAFESDPPDYPATYGILAFSGQRPSLESSGHIVAVNTLNAHPTLGRLALLNCHRPVYPLAFGAPEGVEDWALDEWCDQCHRKGGLVIGLDFFGLPPGHSHGEMLANLIHGKVDALHLNGEYEHPECSVSDLAEWQQLLDCGLRVPFVTGSEKMENLFPIGWQRTYARLKPGEALSYTTWIEAVRAGRTFVTNGPLLSFSVDAQDPGAVIDVSSSRPVVRARAEARSLTPFDRVEIVANGAVVARGATTVEADVTLPQGGWLAARCVGPYDQESLSWTGAQTSPIYVTVDGKPRPADPTAVTHFTACLDKTLDWIVREAQCPTERDRDRLTNVVRTARERLRRHEG